MNQIRQTKGFQKIYAVLSIVNLVFAIALIAFFVILLTNNGKLYYLFIFGLSGLVFLMLTIISFCLWMYVVETYKVTNKIIDRINNLEKNGVQGLDSPINEIVDESNENPNEASNENSTEQSIEELNEVYKDNEAKEDKLEVIKQEKEHKSFFSKEEDLSDFASSLNQEDQFTSQEEKEEPVFVQEEVLEENSEQKHHDVVQEVKNTEDTYQNFNDFQKYNNQSIDAIFANVQESNVKKREQSLKNAAVLKDIHREIEFSDCRITANFINYNEYTLNMDYLEDVKIDETNLNFVLFDIQYSIHFESTEQLHNFIAYLSYMKNRKNR